GGRGPGAVGIHRHAPGADRAEMQPDRSRSRPAIERESQRAMRAITDVVQRVSHEENAGFGFTFAVLDRHHGDGRGVLEGLSANRDLVMSDDWNLFGDWRRPLLRWPRLTCLTARWRSSRLCGWGRLLTRWWLTLPAALCVGALSARQ